MDMKSSNMKNIKAKVKLIYPKQIFSEYETVRPDCSLGLLYIAGILRNHKIPVSVLDMLVGEENDDLEDTFFSRKTDDHGYVHVGMSEEMLKEKLHGYNIVGVSSNYTSQTDNALEVARISKKYDSEILTVAGGWNATALYSLFLENGFDLVAMGEGEETMLEIVNAFEKGIDYANISGIAFKDNQGKIQVNPRRPVLKDLDKLPFPAWDMLPLDKFWKISQPQSRTLSATMEIQGLPMQTSRGCAFRCKYCHNSEAGDAAVLRFKSYDRIMAEAEKIISLGGKSIYFYDDSLMAKKARAIKILEGFKNRNIDLFALNGINICTLFSRKKDSSWEIDTDLLATMKECGINQINIGVESGSQRILDTYASGKWNLKKHDVLGLIKTIHKDYGFKTLGYFTIGYPDETLEELTETFMLAQKLHLAGMDEVAFNIVTPLPGTALYSIALKNGNFNSQLDFNNFKTSEAHMLNTVIPPEVLNYTRKLVYSLLQTQAKSRELHS